MVTPHRALGRPGALPYVVAIAPTVAAAVACSSGGPTDAQPTPAATYYRAALPAGVSASGDPSYYPPNLHAADVVLHPDGTFTLGVLSTGAGAGFVRGTWAQSAGAVTFTFPVDTSTYVPLQTSGGTLAGTIGGDSVTIPRVFVYANGPGSPATFRKAAPTGAALAAGQYVLRLVNGRPAPDTAGFVAATAADTIGTDVYRTTTRIRADTLTFSDGVFVETRWAASVQRVSSPPALSDGIGYVGGVGRGAYDAAGGVVVLRWYGPATVTSVGATYQYDSLSVRGDTLVRSIPSGLPRLSAFGRLGPIMQAYVRVR